MGQILITGRAGFIGSHVAEKGLISYAKAHPVTFSYKLMRRTSIAILFFLALGGIWIERKEYARLLFLISVPFYFMFVHLFIDVGPKHILSATWAYLFFSVIFIENLLER